MNFKSCFWIASKMLFSNSWKIILPVLGILIGIASVITIYSIAEGGKAVVEKDLAFFAENRVMIGIVNENVSRKNYMDIKDIRLIESLPGVVITSYSIHYTKLYESEVFVQFNPIRRFTCF